MSEWKEFREELLHDPEVKAAYDAHAADRELARAIIRQRVEQKISQQEMAEKMNVPQSNVSRLESGTRTPTLETLQRAAAALGVPLEIRFGSQIVALSGGK
ncbi:MAG: helix-turn-helix transcriptional regulator [Clostridia bacterium]|nr:helix-turn-helix transcriptional regulator [Clostridia bacterium]